MKKTLLHFLYEQGIEYRLPHVYLDMDGVLVDLEKEAKKMGFNRAEIEEILDDQGAYGEEYAMIKTREEAEKMHAYVNTLSLERSDNLRAEASKDNEDPEPVSGSKTLTKKGQAKIEINPTEKEPHPSNRHK